jgi:alkanesulfonate monooxygenase SsuD/methylene tetrahydromethanopterin reductase-like flavin-dependent oxidoreductase (luciferase family)
MVDTERMVGLAQLAESLGFESVWTFEHVIAAIAARWARRRNRPSLTR